MEVLEYISRILSTFKEVLFSVFRIASPTAVTLFNVNLKIIKIMRN